MHHADFEDGITELVKEYTDREMVMRAANRYFYLQAVHGKVNHQVTMSDGREMIMLASYSYLGLMGHPKLEAAAKAAIDEYGTGAGGVRLLTGTTDLHERMEARIAQFVSRDDACVYTSGYMTNLAIITGLTGPGDLVIMDKLDHASIVDGCMLSGARWRTYRHNNIEHLESILRRAQGKYKTMLVIADSVFSMDGDMANVPELSKVAHAYGARLMIDEAHSLGALGKTGHGIEEHFGDYNAIDLKMGTLSKSVPSVGGYLAGDHELINYMRHASRPFIFSAGLPPAQCATAMAALDVIEEEPWRVERLQKVQGDYARGLMELGFDTMETDTAIVPVRVGEEGRTMDLTRALFDRGIFVCPIVHPAVPRGTERLRTCLMATHTDEDLAQIFTAFKESGAELGLIKS